MSFGAEIPGEFAGLGLAAYLSAPKAATVALAAEVTLDAWDNVAEALLVVREWKSGGGPLGQATRSLNLIEGPQSVSVSHAMTTEASVVEPLLMIRREAGGPGMLALTIRGLAFGDVGSYRDWRFDTAADKWT